jgi:histidyl-tRNA synthetase
MSKKKTSIKKLRTGVKRLTDKPNNVIDKKVSITAVKSIKQGNDKKKIPELFLPPKGMHDVLPQDAPIWEKVIETARCVAEFYDFAPLETPVLEKIELFIKGVGEKTDIVEKEMYTIRTKGGGRLALRPEGTAPAVRSYLQHGMHRLPQPQRFYYVGPFFRHERPQSGRYRQFHHFGIETIGGDSDPIYDAQIINAFYRIIEELKLKSSAIHINSIGCRMCRSGYQTKLLNYYKKQEICRDCEGRIKENPLRLLDCKKDSCQQIRAEAPTILDSLCSPCRAHLKQVLEYLEEISVPYMLDPFLVRGLDYYNRTVFEIFLDSGELAVAAGGRYDYLAEMIGGRATPASGAALGIERIIDFMRGSELKVHISKPRPKIFLVYVGDLAKKKSLPILEEFRKNHMPIAITFNKNSLSSQLEFASKKEAPIALILGQKEVYEESIIIRDMGTGAQESVPITKVIDNVKKKMRS